MVLTSVGRTTWIFWLGSLLSCQASEGPENKPNRLLHEKSPYLLQHAYNPVNWYPWGEEAF